MRLIGFCGYMGSGKTFAADYLVEKYGYTRIKFAGPLKDMLRTMGLTEEHIEGKLKDVPSDLLCGRTPRWAMQSLGTEWGRECIGENLWGNIWESQVKELLKSRRPVVVDDCRFDNEVARVKRLGGLVCLLTSKTSGTDATHPSENLPSNPDVHMTNNHGHDLYQMLDALVGKKIVA